MASAAIQFVLVLMTASFLTGTNGLKCYKCGGGGEDEKSCEDFASSLLKSSFEVECYSTDKALGGILGSLNPTTEICQKTVINGREIRSCGVSLKNLKQYSNSCEFNICICDTDLCNSAGSLRYSAALLIVTLLAARIIHL